MIVDRVKTWGEAVDFTFKTRDTWRHGNGRVTHMYNCKHVTNQLGNSFPLNKITPMMLNQVLMDLEKERQMSSSTQNRVISSVSTVLRHCKKFEVIDFEPPTFDRRKEGEHRLTYFTKEEVEQMVNGAVDPYGREDMARLILTAAYTGMRQGELLKLRVNDIEFAKKLIHVGGRDGFVTKAKNYRALPINDRIYTMLSERCEYASPDAYVFADDWGGGKDQVLRTFKKVRNYSIKKGDSWAFHTLRHSHATWLAEAGVPVRTIMYLMGHKNIETTLRYMKVTDQSMFEAINAL